MRRTQADRRQRLTVQHGDGKLGALYPLFDQRFAVVGLRALPGVLQLLQTVSLGHADAGTFVQRLDDQRRAQALDNLGTLLAITQHGVSRRRQA